MSNNKEAHIKITGYKKSMKRIQKLKKNSKELRDTLERISELMNNLRL